MDTLKVAGSPKDCAVRSIVGWLASIPAITPAAVPITTGTRICPIKVAVTWPGVKPIAFITPTSRRLVRTTPLTTLAIVKAAASSANRENAKRTGTYRSTTWLNSALVSRYVVTSPTASRGSPLVIAAVAVARSAAVADGSTR